MHNYCTLFDSNYLSRGLAMFESLKAHAGLFHLYIFAFDDISYHVLTELNLEHVTTISLGDFEDDALLAIKKSRSKGEYCWTCTPSVIKYCIEHYVLDSCTYLDADLYFFADPAVLINEMGDKSVLITEHRYTPKYDQSHTSGIYCVQFMTFKNTKDGLEALNWWRDACIDWCYARFEDGKFGDQKYLDDWPERFAGVHVLKNRQGGVAPWNVQQYSSYASVIFYHFHDFKFLDEGYVDFGHYELSAQAKRSVYNPYVGHLVNIANMLVQAGFDDHDYHGTTAIKRDLRFFWACLKRKIKGNFHIHLIDEILGS